MAALLFHVAQGKAILFSWRCSFSRVRPCQSHCTGLALPRVFCAVCLVAHVHGGSLHMSMGCTALTRVTSTLCTFMVMYWGSQLAPRLILRIIATSCVVIVYIHERAAPKTHTHTQKQTNNETRTNEQTLNTQHSTLNTQHSTLNTQLSTHHTHHTHHMLVAGFLGATWLLNLLLIFLLLLSIV